MVNEEKNVKLLFYFSSVGLVNGASPLSEYLILMSMKKVRNACRPQKVPIQPPLLPPLLPAIKRNVIGFLSFSSDCFHYHTDI